MALTKLIIVSEPSLDIKNSAVINEKCSTTVNVKRCWTHNKFHKPSAPWWKITYITNSTLWTNRYMNSSSNMIARKIEHWKRSSVNAWYIWEQKKPHRTDSFLTNYYHAGISARQQYSKRDREIWRTFGNSDVIQVIVLCLQKRRENEMTLT